MTRLAHLSDVHLAFKAHQRLTATGANQRSADVALAFRAAVDGILAAHPDLVLCGGDLFHEPRPANPAILFAFAQFERLQAASIPVVLVAGNHDVPRRADTGCILGLFEKCGVAVAIHEARQFVYPALDLRVVALPHTAVMQGVVPAPEGSERWQVLLAHAEVQGIYRKSGDRASGQIPAEGLNDPRWSAVCLGDYHKQHQVGLRAWYSGSTEFTSSNPWEELDTPKGWLLWDLEAGTVEPQLLPVMRPHLDLGVLDATGLTGAQVNEILHETLGSVDIEGAIVRLTVVNIPAPIRADLDHEAIREWKCLAHHLKLDYESPVRVPTAVATVGRGQTLDEIVTNWFQTFPLTPGLDRGRFTELATKLMAETGPGAGEIEKRGAA